MPALRLVVPARGAGPSGGDVYDAQLARAWEATQGPVEVVALPGPWPKPRDAERDALRRALGTSGTVLLDGLVGSACPQEVAGAVAAGVRVVLLVHLPLPAEAGLPTAEAERLAALEARTVRAASGVVVTSHWAARDLAQRYGRPDLLVAEPGVERGPVATGSSAPHLLVLGALTRVKNHRVLVPALDAVRDLPWRATFAGPAGAQPDVVAELTGLLDGAGLADRVTLPGTVVGPELEELWRGTDLLLLPSLVETYGLVVTEALAHGVPAVVAAGTGAVEALTGRAAGHGDAESGGPGAAASSGDAAGRAVGRWDSGADTPGAAVPPTDAAAWAALLRRWLTDPGQRATWRQAALSRREQLRTWADTAADLAAALG